MVPQSDSPPKPLGATVPHSSLCRWNWAQKLKPLPLHSSEALDAYFWVRGFLGVDQHDHQKKSKILENRLNRLAGYENQTVLRNIKFCRRLLDYLMLWNWLIKSAFSMTFLWWTLKIATNILTFGLFFTASYHTLESLSRRIETRTFQKVTTSKLLHINKETYK